MNSKTRVPDRDPKNVEVTGTMKAYFCYWHTLLQTTSRLFYLFQIDICVLLMDVANGCSLL